jgi:hypothetical protein
MTFGTHHGLFSQTMPRWINYCLDHSRMIRMEFLAHVRTECSYQSLSTSLPLSLSLPPSPFPSKKEHFCPFLANYNQLHPRLLKYLHANEFLNWQLILLAWNSKLPREQFSTNCFSIARLLDHSSLTVQPVSSEICTCKEPAQSQSLTPSQKRYAKCHATASRSPCYSGTRQGLAMRAGGIIESCLCFSSFILSH